MQRFILNISHHLFHISSHLLCITKHSKYILFELPISVYLVCKVDLEFNSPGLKIVTNGYSRILL